MADPTQNNPDQAAGAAEGSSFEQTVMENRNAILGVVALVVVAIAAIVGYKQLFVQPREAQAQVAIVAPQQAFAKDSFNLALNGSLTADGFLSVAKKYGATPTGKLAHGYAAICQLQLGNYDGAIQHGKKFSSQDPLITARVLGVIGHAYSEKGDFAAAEKQYRAAAEASENPVLAPRHYQLAGMAAMERQDFAAAERHFQVIKDRFPRSTEGQGIDKYLALASAKSGN
jgi:tetratricopeptide (TPR) repeat protein